MNFNEMLNDFRDKKTKCFVNGVPSDDGGIITAIIEDYVVFEIINKDTKPHTKEIIYIPINQIFSLSEGEKKVGELGLTLEANKTEEKV